MGNPYPVEITDAEGESRLTGDAVFTDPSNQPGGTTGQGVYSLLTGSIASGASAAAAWTNVSGDAFLSLTAPAAPTFKEAGIYAVTLSMTPNGTMTVAGSFELGLALTPENLYVYTDSAAATAALESPNVTITVVYLVAAGDELACTVENNDGAAAQIFNSNSCTVTKLS